MQIPSWVSLLWRQSSKLCLLQPMDLVRYSAWNVFNLVSGLGLRTISNSSSVVMLSILVWQLWALT